MARPKNNPDPIGNPATTAVRPRRRPDITLAPQTTSGDAIDLQPLIDRTIAIKCVSRKMVNTKFSKGKNSDDTPVTAVLILIEGENEPLHGVLFQRYFGALALDQWIVGIVRYEQRGRFAAWTLDSSELEHGTVDALAEQIAELEDARR